MRARRVLYLLVLLLPLLTGGCTFYVIEQISPTENRYFEYTAAHRDKAGNIIICVMEGIHGPYSMEGDDNLRFILPVEAFSKGPAERPKLEVRTQPELPIYRIPDGGMELPCPDRGSPESEALMSVTVHSTGDGSTGNGDIAEMEAANVSNDALWAYFQIRAETNAIFVFFPHRDGDGPNDRTPSTRKRVVYIHDQPVFAGSRAVELRAGPKKGNLLYVPLLPFTVAHDIVIGAFMGLSYILVILPYKAFS